MLVMACGCSPRITYGGKSAEDWAAQLEGQGDEARNEALQAIESIAGEDPAAIQHLVAAMKSEANDTRLMAIRACSRLGKQAAAAVPALNDVSANDAEAEYIRKEAKLAVEAIQGGSQ